MITAIKNMLGAPTEAKAKRYLNLELMSAKDELRELYSRLDEARIELQQVELQLRKKLEEKTSLEEENRILDSNNTDVLSKFVSEDIHHILKEGKEKICLVDTSVVSMDGFIPFLKKRYDKICLTNVVMAELRDLARATYEPRKARPAHQLISDSEKNPDSYLFIFDNCNRSEKEILLARIAKTYPNVDVVTANTIMANFFKCHNVNYVLLSNQDLDSKTKVGQYWLKCREKKAIPYRSGRIVDFNDVSVSIENRDILYVVTTEKYKKSKAVFFKKLIYIANEDKYAIDKLIIFTDNRYSINLDCINVRCLRESLEKEILRQLSLI